MKTVQEILLKAADHLSKKGIANSRRQAEEILSDALDISRIELYMQFDRPLNEEELVKCRDGLTRRASGEPCQYIRGKVDFLGCEIHVNRSVLIPRQETEILAEKIVNQIGDEGILWDLCTGSGCLGIAIKKRKPKLQVAISDLSSEALTLAKQNALLNQVQIEAFEGDFLTPFKGMKANYVVCNPPYIREDEYSLLDREVRDFEPKQALVSGKSGLEFYQKLSQKLPEHLFPNGELWCEIGKGQGESVQALFSQFPWKEACFEADWSGNDRFFRAILK